MARVAWLLSAPGPAREATLAKGVGPNFEGHVLHLLAEGLAAAKQYDDAEHAAEAAGNPESFMSVIAHAVIASHLGAGGQWDRAYAAARKSGHYRPRAFASMAASSGDDRRRAVELAAQAEAAAREQLEPFWRTKALSDVAVALADVDPERATRLAAETAEAVERGFEPIPIGKIAGVLAAHGEMHRAQRVADALEDPSNRAWAVAGICGVLAAQGHVSEAINTARMLAQRPYLVQPLATIAGLAAPTDPESAVSLAGQVLDAIGVVTNNSAGLLAYSAEALRVPLPLDNERCQTALQTSADCLLVLALVDQYWSAAMPAFGQMEPGLVVAIYRTFIEELEATPGPIFRLR